jgi:phosphoglycolate phosphatase
MKKALFFDMDGTLWDALVPLMEAYNIAQEREGTSYRYDLDLIKSFMGLTPEETGKLNFPNETPERQMELFRINLAEELKYLAIHPGKLYPHEEEVLEKLQKKYDLFVVSNADKGYIENYMNALNMRKYFKDFVQAGDTGLPKWKNILWMKDKYGYELEDIIYIGDTLKDKEESDRAGVKFIHAAYGFGVIEDDKYKINSLLELEELVDKMFKA